MSEKKKPLAEQVIDKIYHYIIENSLNIGTKLPSEFELADLFGVGRSTIREAIKGLSSRGIVEVRRGDGTYIMNTRFSEDDPLGIRFQKDRFKLAMDLVNVRIILEPEIASMAAENATEEQIKEVIAQCDLTEKKIKEGEDYTKEDIVLHKLIAGCTQNAVVEKLIPIINSSVVTFVNITHKKLKEETIITHRNVVNAIVQRDPIGARCAMMMHLTYNRQKIQELMRQMEEENKEKQIEICL